MIWTLDVATTTGWCAGRGDTSPRLGHIKMPSTGDEVGPFLDFFFRWCHQMVSDLQAEAEVETTEGMFGPRNVKPRDLICVFEAPLLPRAKFDPDPTKKGRIIQAPVSLATTRKLQGLVGVLEMVCHQRNLLVEEVNVQTVRAAMGAVAGNAKGEDTMAAAQRCGLSPKVHDEADAFGVWILAMRAYAKTYQHLWDQKLYGPRSPRGGLV